MEDNIHRLKKVESKSFTRSLKKVFKVTGILIICICLFLFMSSCGKENQSEQNITAAEREQIIAKALNMLRTSNYTPFIFEYDVYNEETSVYSVYAVSRDGILRARVDMSEIEFEDGKLISFKPLISYWDGEKYCPESDYNAFKEFWHNWSEHEEDL